MLVGMANELTDERVGKMVVELREARGLNQGQLSEQLRASGLNWSQGTLSKVEAGMRPVRLTEAPTLALALRTSVGALVGENRSKLSGLMPAPLQHEVLDQQEWISDALEQARGIRALANDAIPRLERSRDTTSRVLDHLVGKSEDEYVAGPPVERDGIGQ